MNRRALLFSTCILLLSFTVLNAPAAGVDISVATVINSPGVYVLQKDIINSGSNPFIAITASDVTFDGNGHMIDGLDLPGTLPKRYGIYVHSLTTLSNVTVRNVTLRDWHSGIFYYNVIDGSIENCNAVSNTENGFFLSLASNTTISKCSVSSNDDRGVNLESSSNNFLIGNDISLNRYGVRLFISSNNLLTENRIYGSDYGIYLASSSGNAIYNNLLNNTANAVVADINANIWNIAEAPGSAINGGPHLGGNLWLLPDDSGYSSTTPDRDDDGICDEPYTIAGNNVDQLPLAAIPGQHIPLFGPEWPVRFLRPADGEETAQPTAYYFLFDNSSHEGKEDHPDTLRFVVKMLDPGLTLAANVSELDGNTTPLSPYLISGTEHYFAYPLGNASFGDIGSYTRTITIHAYLGAFQNSTSGIDGSPSPLTVVMNPSIASADSALNSTDLRDIGDFTAVEGFTLEKVLDNETFGSISFPGPLNLCDPAFADALPSLWDNIQIEENAIALDTAASGLATLNASATLMMHASSFTATPGIFRNGEPDLYANGTPAAGSTIKNVLWDNSTKILRFDIIHWTRYHADGSGPEVIVDFPANATSAPAHTVEVRGTASDPSGISFVELQVNGGAWEIANGTGIWNCTIPLTEGYNTIIVRATDRIGCTSTRPLTLYRPIPLTTTPALAPSPSPSEQPAQRGRSNGGGHPGSTHFIGNATLTTTGWGEVLRTITITSEDGVVRLAVPSGTRVLDAKGEPLKEISIWNTCAGEVLEDSISLDRNCTSCMYQIGTPGLRFDPPLRMDLLLPGEAGLTWMWCELNGTPECSRIQDGSGTASGGVGTEISHPGFVCVLADLDIRTASPTSDLIGEPSTPPASEPAPAQGTPQSGRLLPLKEILSLFMVIFSVGVRRILGR